MWGRKKEDQELITIGSPAEGDKGSYVFEKTQLYTLTGNQVITVPQGYTANVYFKFADPLTVTPCIKKNLIKAAKISGDKMGKQFYVIFTSSTGLARKYWGAGQIPVKCSGAEFQVGANGYFDVSVTDVDKYISTLGEGASAVFTSEGVLERMKVEIRNRASELLADLFDQVDALIIHSDFLIDEFNVILNDYFVRGDIFEQFGVKIPFINVGAILICEDDILRTRKQVAEATLAESRRNAARGGAAGGGVRRTVGARTRKPAAKSDDPTKAPAVRKPSEPKSEPQG